MMPEFSSKEEIAHRLFDESVTHDMTHIEKVRLAVLSAAAAEKLWEEYR